MSKILVVDNQPAFIKFMVTLLEKQGHTVSTARDGLGSGPPRRRGLLGDGRLGRGGIGGRL